MKIPITIAFADKKDKVYYKDLKVPTAWGDLTLGQLIDISKLDPNAKNRKAEVYSIITGLTQKEILSATDLDYWQQVESMLSFLQVEADFKVYPVPTSVEFRLPGDDTGTFDRFAARVPADLRLETFGQKVALEELVRHVDPSDAGDINLLPIMPEALAIYFYPIITGEPFDDEKVETVIDLMKTLPAKHAMPIAGFFLSNYTLSSTTSDES
ncbi:hypothetical protein [Pedobacter sp. SYP-B3415]|uniref:hypothetical protein n=1 Tax=Pedobacter sp. SYP-B3415 TaxID=2496641 RepID=UPI00101DD3E3|nr:hypothetical protein [Pedobacter sp. SYP-B3415]